MEDIKTGTNIGIRSRSNDLRAMGADLGCRAGFAAAALAVKKLTHEFERMNELASN